MKRYLTAAMLFLSACGGASSPSTGSDASTDTSPTGGSVTLVGTWLGPSIHRPGDQYIELTSTSVGTAALWWYGGGYATWSVSATDDGVGGAMLVLTCTNQQCASDDPIVYQCTYTRATLSCLGISGGRDNSYDFANSGRSAPDVYTRS